MPRNIGSEFMHQTRHDLLEIPDQQLGRPEPPATSPPDRPVGRVALPPPAEAAAVAPDLHALITQRSSLRRYGEQPLSAHELSFLLWCTQGVKHDSRGGTTMRTVPSAGARHAFETMLLVHRVAAIAPGLYQFDAPHHELHALKTRPDLSDRLVDACYGQTFLRASAVTFLWIGIPYRMTWRYGERGYRYLHLDAGHVAQNLYLAAESIRAGACAVAAFDDQAINSLLGLDGESAFVVYLAAVGKRR